MTKTVSITSEQTKQWKRMVEDFPEKALKKLRLDKDGLQRVLEQGDDLENVFLDAVAELAKPKPKFVNDRTNDGWELVEDVGFEPVLTSPAQLELVSFLKDGESYVNGEVMVERARGELHAKLGQQHAEWLLANQKNIPQEFRKYYLVFTGTVWRYPDGHRCVAYLSWRGARWYLHFYWLGYDFDGSHRLPRLRE